MIQFGTQLSKKQRKSVESILQEYIDEYRDFYITKENLRLFLQENEELLFEALKKGDKIAFSEEDGIVYVTGYSDNFPRKYLKILSKDLTSADRLLKILLWNLKTDLYVKIKIKNPILSVLQKNGFIFKGSRGREILLMRKYIGDDNG